jgi:hypothetical protein
MRVQLTLMLGPFSRSLRLEADSPAAVTPNRRGADLSSSATDSRHRPA